jgi:hypothetical protein
MNKILHKIQLNIESKNYKLAINILEKKIQEDTKNHLYYFLLGKCYLLSNNIEKAFLSINEAVNINPYGMYGEEVYSELLNRISVKYDFRKELPSIILDSMPNSVHSRALYPLANVYFPQDIGKVNADFILVPNWLSPYNTTIENLDELNITVVSMIIDRLMFAEEHLKANYICSDLIIAMENYAPEIYKKIGFENVIYVPCAGSVGYEPTSYPKLNLEKTYDVVFLGKLNDKYIYHKRNRILDKLNSLSHKYKILIKPCESYEEYWNLMNSAKICIDVTIDSKALNYRMFQAMGIGTICFAEDDNDMVTELYNDKEDLVLYNENNLDELIEYYLNNEEERNIIALNGMKKTNELYTHYHFMKMALDEIKKNTIIKSQKNTLSKDKIKLYKSVMFYFQNKYLQALKTLEDVSNNNSEKINNEMVVKMKLFEIYKDNNFLDQIKLLETTNSNNIISRFNILIFKKFILKVDVNDILEILKDDLTKNNFNNREGLIYIPDKEKDLYDYFKYEQGQIIFQYGLDTDVYYEKLLDLIKKITKI